MKSDNLITNTYEELFSIENIYAGHLKSRASRRSKKPIIKFEISALGNIYELHKKLLNGTFRFGGYNTFIVYEPKRREIQNMRYCDRVIQHVICDNMLTPYFSDRVIYDNCVCQKGKGSHFALDRFENMIRKHIDRRGARGYFLKCDVLKFFASIPHDKLKAAVCSRILDARIRKMIEGIIDGYHTSVDFLQKYDIKPLCDGEKTGRGIPIGNQTSQIFGMFYLDPVDRLIKEHFRINAYSRYMDDFVLLHENLDYLRFVKDSISDLVERLGLKLNSKTQIFPIKNGVTYLGYRFCVTQDGKIIKTIKKQTKRRFRWRVKLIKKGYFEGLINIERVRQTCSAFHGHLKHAMSIKFAKELQRKLSPIEEKEKIIEEQLDLSTYTRQKEYIKEMTYNVDQEIAIELLGADKVQDETQIKTAVEDEMQNPERASRKPFRITDFDQPKDREMAVFTGAKKLSEYIFVITEKSPKTLRWSIVSRLMDTSTAVIENLYHANFERDEKRAQHQKQAMVNLCLLDFYAETAKTKQAITNKQAMIIARLIYDVKRMLNGWIRSKQSLK